MKINSKTYLLRLWAEVIAFQFSRLLLIPAKIHLLASRCSHTWLSYADLMRINSQFKCIEKQSPMQEIAQQKKWANRVAQIADIYQARKILEVGCGNGLAAFQLLGPKREIYANDLVDQINDQVKASPVKFTLGDVCQQLPYTSDSFDLIFSINSFEHFDYPLAALKEMIRVLRPNGILFLAFSPLYYSPWGLHASRRLGMPYPQLLFPSSVIQQFVAANQATLATTYSDFADRTRIGPALNGYSLEQYRQVMKAQRPCLKTMAYVESISLDGLKIIHHYPGIIKDKIPSLDNLFISGIKLLARKRPVTSAPVSFDKVK